VKDYSTNLGRKKRNPNKKKEKEGARHIRNRKNRIIENEKISRNKD